jgi:hypothetical protein
MKMTAFRDIAACSLVEVDHVSEVCTTSIIRVMEAVRISKTLVYFIEPTRHYIPESCHLQLLKVFYVYKTYLLSNEKGVGTLFWHVPSDNMP